jgi:hypothetical protein
MAKLESIETELAPKDIGVMTQSVDQDEKVYWLVEETFTAKNYRGKERYQIIYVNRDDKLAAWVGIVDDAEGVDYPQFRIPGLWEHNVAEMQEMAQLMRYDNTLDKLMAEQAGNSTLINDMMILAERRQAILANRTVFGAGKTTTGAQRIGFHPSRKETE